MLVHLSKVAAKAHSNGELEPAQELYEHLVAARRERYGDRDVRTVGAIGALASVAKDRGEFLLAEGLAREAADASKATLGAMHPESLKLELNLVAVLARVEGKLDEAEQTARDALEGYRQVLGEEAHASAAKSVRAMLAQGKQATHG